MSDNFIANAGSGGSTFAADDIGGVLYPRTKLSWGADNSAVDASATNPLPVTDAVITGTASLTALNQALTMNLGGTKANTTFQLTGTWTGTVTFEASNDGFVNSTSIFAFRAGDSAVPATTVTNSTNNDIYRCSTAGFTAVRARCSDFTSGTIVITSNATESTSGVFLNFSLPPGGNTIGALTANQSVNVAQMGGVATSMNAGVVDAGTQRVILASNQSAVSVSEQSLLITGQAAQTAVINNILPATAGAAGTDVANYRAASVQVVSTGTAGTFIFEQSNDNVNWVAMPVFNAALVTGVPITAAITATVSQIVYSIPLRCNFLRLRIATLITGGSIQAFSRISTEPWTPSAALVASSTAANLQATVSGTVTANIGTGAIAAGANAIGDVGIQGRANATGAASVAKILALATTNATLVKSTAGRVFGWHLTNTTAAIKVVRLYNLTVAPTVGTSVPFYVIYLPANASVDATFPVGIGHTTGISYAITGAIADLDATAVAANDVLGAIYWL